MLKFFIFLGRLHKKARWKSLSWCMTNDLRPTEVFRSLQSILRARGRALAGCSSTSSSWRRPTASSKLGWRVGSFRQRPPEMHTSDIMICTRKLSIHTDSPYQSSRWAHTFALSGRCCLLSLLKWRSLKKCKSIVSLEGQVRRLANVPKSSLVTLDRRSREFIWPKLDATKLPGRPNRS